MAEAGNIIMLDIHALKHVAIYLAKAGYVIIAGYPRIELCGNLFRGSRIYYYAGYPRIELRGN